MRLPLTGLYLGKADVFNRLRLRQTLGKLGNLPELFNILRLCQKHLTKLGKHRMGFLFAQQCPGPFGQREANLPHRKFVEHRFQQRFHALFIKRLTVDAFTAHLILFRQFCFKRLRRFTARFL